MSMRDQIARAIADEVGRRKNVSVEQLADAALNALMEPTEGMLDAMQALYDDVGVTTKEPAVLGMGSWVTAVQAAKEGR